MTTKSIAILSLDIETNGPDLLKHEIISIGYCVGDLVGNVINKERINFKYDTVFEPDCWKFWSKYLSVLDKLKEGQLTPYDAINKFIIMVDELDTKYDLRIITDNPSFDISFINYYLNKYLGRLPITYIHGIGHKYRCIFDTDSFARGALHQNYADPWTSDSKVTETFGLTLDASHSHFPDDDAEYIYKLHIALVNRLQVISAK